MRIAAVQHDIVWEDRDANFARLAPMIAGAAGGGRRARAAHRDVLHRLLDDAAASASPRAARRRSSSPSRPPSTASGSAVAARRSPDAAGDDQRPYNTFVLAGPDGTTHRYRKIHPFTYGGETSASAPATKPVTVEVDGLRVTPFVCYDLRFADEFWQAAPRHRRLPGAGELAEPAPAATGRRCCRRGRSRTRPTSSAATGSGRRATAPSTCGDSRIVSPMGELLATAAGGRDDPARRRRRRRGGRHPRPVPVPARPPRA